MLLSDSEKAKKLRSVILDIVIATINEKAGGGTKYINWRDREYLPAAIQEENYRKNFTSAVNECVEGHTTFKYSQVTDMIYSAVFFEKAKEYKELLKLDKKDSARATMYAEVLRVISSFENGIASAIRQEFGQTGSLLSIRRVQALIKEQAESAATKVDWTKFWFLFRTTTTIQPLKTNSHTLSSVCVTDIISLMAIRGFHSSQVLTS